MAILQGHCNSIQTRQQFLFADVAVVSLFLTSPFFSPLCVFQKYLISVFECIEGKKISCFIVPSLVCSVFCLRYRTPEGHFLSAIACWKNIKKNVTPLHSDKKPQIRLPLVYYLSTSSNSSPLEKKIHNNQRYIMIFFLPSYDFFPNFSLLHIIILFTVALKSGRSDNCGYSLR